MLTIDIPAELAEQALLTLAAHVPLTVEIGRPVVATAAAGMVVLLTSAGTWWVRPGLAERTADLPDGRRETARWSGGVELSRVIDTE